MIASNGEWMMAVYYESSYYSSASAYYIVQVGDLRDHGIPFNGGRGQRNRLTFLHPYEFYVNAVKVPLRARSESGWTPNVFSKRASVEHLSYLLPLHLDEPAV